MRYMAPMRKKCTELKIRFVQQPLQLDSPTVRKLSKCWADASRNKENNENNINTSSSFDCCDNL